LSLTCLHRPRNAVALSQVHNRVPVWQHWPVSVYYAYIHGLAVVATVPSRTLL